jgi:hypothetical protein
VLRDRYEAIDTLETIAADRVTDLFLVEPQLFELMDHPDLESADLSSLRTLILSNNLQMSNIAPWVRGVSRLLMT